MVDFIVYLTYFELMTVGDQPFLLLFKQEHNDGYFWLVTYLKCYYLSSLISICQKAHMQHSVRTYESASSVKRDGKKEREGTDRQSKAGGD